MKGYLYEHEVKERGYVDIPAEELSDCELDKYSFVTFKLDPALYESKCGWESLQYRVMETSSGIRTEFLVLWAEGVGTSGSRWINVTGNSLGAIMCAMCDNLW